MQGLFIPPLAPLVLALGWALTHFVWQGGVIALLVVGTLSLLRHSAPSTRYAVACGGLLAMAIMPVVTLWVSYAPIPPAAIHSLPYEAQVPAAQDELPLPAAPGVSFPESSSVAWEWEGGVSELLPWLVGGWLAGLLALSAWRTGGWIYVQYLRRWGGQPVVPVWQERLDQLCQRLQVRLPVRLLESLRVEAPVVIGWLRPVILMPVGVLSGLSLLQVEAILLHELAHIRRYDYLVNLLQTAVEILLFYHPAVWWMSRRIREEREYCCDDVAVAACGNVLGYARALTALEEWRGSTPQLGMAADGGALLERVQRLVERSRAPAGAGWQAGVVMPVLLLGWLLLGAPLEGHGAAEGTGRIAFMSTRDGNNEIYAMDTDGKNVVRLTYDQADDLHPRWSPDGKWIAFQSNRGGSHKIYVMEADGSHLRRLTQGPGHDLYPQWSPDGRQIAFFSSRDGNNEIYVMNADGSGQTRLTYTSRWNQTPSWSPDGVRIAFMSARDGNDEIYVMNADGSEPRRLTHHEADDNMPAWSPDGVRIAFMSARDGNNEIYVMNADGSEPRRLTDNLAIDSSPSWSPDGTQILFWSSRDGNEELYVVNADGSGQRRLTYDSASDGSASWTASSMALTQGAEEQPPAENINLPPEIAPALAPQEPDLRIARDLAFVSFRDSQYDIYTASEGGSEVKCLTGDPARDSYPAWSPDRTRIAFISLRDGNPEVYVMGADGSEQKRLTNDGAYEGPPKWSPDGRQLVFSSTRDGNAELYVMNADGTALQRLTAHPAADDCPSWSPDGRRIAFQSNREGSYKIYVMETDGSHLRRLTQGPGHDLYPQWSPDGRQIAFASTRDTDEEDLEIYVMNADGTGVRRLTRAPFHDMQPSWSPDGTKIIFHSNRTGQGTDAIYTMNPDGSDQRLLLSNPPGIDNSASWAPFQHLGTTAVGTPLAQAMVIENKGRKILAVSDIVSSDGQFTVSPKRFRVMPGGRQEVEVRFAPISGGTKYATLTIRSNDPEAPVARLMVNGIARSVQVAGR